MRDLAYDLAANAAKVKYTGLPEDVIEITKKFILDTLATTLAGSSAPGCNTVIDYVKENGGRKESTIMVYGGKVPSAEAAFANGMMAHALDFDDTHDEAVIHANVSVMPAALAMAEGKGGVSGKDLIEAIAGNVKKEVVKDKVVKKEDPKTSALVKAQDEVVKTHEGKDKPSESWEEVALKAYCDENDIKYHHKAGKGKLLELING